MRGSARQRKKIAKRMAQRPKPYEQLGYVFADIVASELKRPAYTFRLWASDDEYLAWENTQHPWWTRTRRR